MESKQKNGENSKKKFSKNNEKLPSTSKSASEGEIKITTKLKILCLHGYRQNADSFKSKIGSFRKFVSKYADFVFINAPHHATPLPDVEQTDEDRKTQRSWWSNKDDGSFKGTNKCGPAVGFEDSLKLVEHIWATEGPFQGLLGFSQGACFAGLICDMSVRNKTKIQPEFVILSSGFRSGSLVHTHYYDHDIPIPSLQIFGETDEIIPKEMSELLASRFETKEILIHPGGHYFPATKLQKDIYVNFIQDRLQDYLEALEIFNASEQNSIILNGRDSENEESSD